MEYWWNIDGIYILYELSGTYFYFCKIPCMWMEPEWNIGYLDEF